MRLAWSRVLYALEYLLKRPALIFIPPLLLLSFYIRLDYANSVYSANAGFIKTHDSYWYIDHANELVQYFKIQPDLNGVFYICYYGMLAFFLLVFKTESSIVIFQVVISALCVYLVYRIAEISFSSFTGLIAGIVYIFSPELMKWSVYLLTDSLFASAIILAVFSILKFRISGKRIYAIIFAVSCIYMAFLRPAGGIVALIFAVYLIAFLDYGKLLKAIYAKPLIYCPAITVIIFIGIFSVTGVMRSSVGTSFFWNLRWLLYGNYSAGQIFDLPSAYDYSFAAVKNSVYFDNFVLSYFTNNWREMLALYNRRFITFWDVSLWEAVSFGRIKENYTSILQLGIVAAGMLRAMVKETRERAAVLFVPVISTLLFCIVFFMDTDWRYKLPCVAFLGIFAAYGACGSVGTVLLLLNWIYTRGVEGSGRASPLKILWRKL